jgi:hypothetical protein
MNEILPPNATLVSQTITQLCLSVKSKILITRREDGALDIQNGNFREMHYGHVARKPKHMGVVSVQNVTIWPIGTSLANFRPAKVSVSQSE